MNEKPKGWNGGCNEREEGTTHNYNIYYIPLNKSECTSHHDLLFL